MRKRYYTYYNILYYMAIRYESDSNRTRKSMSTVSQRLLSIFLLIYWESFDIKIKEWRYGQRINRRVKVY